MEVEASHLVFAGVSVDEAIFFLWYLIAVEQLLSKSFLLYQVPPLPLADFSRVFVIIMSTGISKLMAFPAPSQDI